MTTALCATVMQQLHPYTRCVDTKVGVRVRTACLYPAFDPVHVYIAALKGGFLVHDAGEALEAIESSGVQSKVGEKAIRQECSFYDLDFNAGASRIELKIDAAEWLESGIIALANAAAAAARSALMEARKPAETHLADMLEELLLKHMPNLSVLKKFSYEGESGRTYKFDLAIPTRDRLTLIETVSPHAGSVNAKFVALSDLPSDGKIFKIAAHRGDLSPPDKLLLQKVATVARPDGVRHLVQEQRAGLH